ncbi:TPA: hypothetical protein ACHJ1E_005237, partial [Escherichia coli]
EVSVTTLLLYEFRQPPPVAGFFCIRSTGMLHTSQLSQLNVVCPDENLLEKNCMVNPPERRGDW